MKIKQTNNFKKIVNAHEMLVGNLGVIKEFNNSEYIGHYVLRVSGGLISLNGSHNLWLLDQLRALIMRVEILPKGTKLEIECDDIL